MSNNRVKCSVEGIVGRIEQIGERTVKHVSTAMGHYAELIVHAAQLNAPHDTGRLEDSIHAEQMRNGINGRLWIKITIHPLKDNYGAIMEEYLLPHGKGGGNSQAADGDYDVREKSIAKGPQAGGHFMKRAFAQYRDELIQKANEIARRAAAR